MIAWESLALCASLFSSLALLRLFHGDLCLLGHLGPVSWLVAQIANDGRDEWQKNLLKVDGYIGRFGAGVVVFLRPTTTLRSHCEPW